MDCVGVEVVWELVQIIPGSGDALPGILAAACGMGFHSEQESNLMSEPYKDNSHISCVLHRFISLCPLRKRSLHQGCLQRGHWEDYHAVFAGRSLGKQ
jgi:hypothetical protein